MVGTAAGQAPCHGQLHPSVRGHLETELALLTNLRNKSKDQHRSQPFLRRLEQVIRMVKTVQSHMAKMTTATDRLVVPHTQAILTKFKVVLETAARATYQIIELRHFLPLQVMLLGSYSRLFTLYSHIQQKLLGDLNTQRPKQESTVSSVADIGPHKDIGRPIARPIIDVMDMDVDMGLPLPIQSDPKLAAKPALSSVNHLNAESTSTMGSTDEIVEVAEKKKKKRAPEQTTKSIAKKKKRRDAMDDIFGGL